MAELVSSLLMRAVNGGPEDPPAVPKLKNVDATPLAAAPKDPGNVPGVNDKTMGAGAADEKRRILRAMPSKTENTFAGNTTESAPVKKRVLGAATAGRQTTGE